MGQGGGREGVQAEELGSSLLRKPFLTEETENLTEIHQKSASKSTIESSFPCSTFSGII